MATNITHICFSLLVLVFIYLALLLCTLSNLHGHRATCLILIVFFFVFLFFCFFLLLHISTVLRLLMNSEMSSALVNTSSQYTLSCNFMKFSDRMIRVDIQQKVSDPQLDLREAISLQSHSDAFDLSQYQLQFYRKYYKARCFVFPFSSSHQAALHHIALT